MMKTIAITLSIMMILVIFGGCDSSEKKTLCVYFDEVLGPAVPEIMLEFEKNSGCTVKLIADPEDRVFRRMKLSKHADLYISITPYLIERASDFGLSKGGEEIGVVKPALITAPLNPLKIDSVDNLKEVDIHFGILKEGSTLGVTTKRLFEKNGFNWEEVLRAVHYPAENEAMLIEGIQNGMIDVAIIWDIVAREGERIEYVAIKPEENVSLPVVAMPLEKSEHPQEVADLVKFMKSPEGQAVWEEFGLSSQKDAEKP